jgi:hypothetical protein
MIKMLFWISVHDARDVCLGRFYVRASDLVDPVVSGLRWSGLVSRQSGVGFFLEFGQKF